MIGELLKRALDRIVPGGRVLTRGRTPHVFLTFDDGPHPEVTPRVLDALAEANVRATFFVIGRAASDHPALVRRAFDEGHTIGHHSFTHGNPARTDSSTLAREASATAALLTPILGRPPRLFRPPRGSMSVSKLGRLLLLGQSVVFWSLDPRDYACASETAVAATLAARPPRARDIVLLHDDNPHLPAALPAYFARVRESGLEFSALPG